MRKVFIVMKIIKRNFSKIGYTMSIAKKQKST